MTYIEISEAWLVWIEATGSSSAKTRTGQRLVFGFSFLREEADFFAHIEPIPALKPERRKGEAELYQLWYVRQIGWLSLACYYDFLTWVASREEYSFSEADLQTLFPEGRPEKG